MKVKHILSLVLAAFLTLSVTSPVFGVNINTDASVVTVVGVEEQKVFSTATMDDDFEDDKVIVVLSNIASLNCKTYGTSDFSEISCTHKIGQMDRSLIKVKGLPREVLFACKAGRFGV